MWEGKVEREIERGVEHICQTPRNARTRICKWVKVLTQPSTQTVLSNKEINLKRDQERQWVKEKDNTKPYLWNAQLHVFPLCLLRGSVQSRLKCITLSSCLSGALFFLLTSYGFAGQTEIYSSFHIFSSAPSCLPVFWSFISSLLLLNVSRHEVK